MDLPKRRLNSPPLPLRLFPSFIFSHFVRHLTFPRYFDSLVSFSSLIRYFDSFDSVFLWEKDVNWFFYVLESVIFFVVSFHFFLTQAESSKTPTPVRA